MLQIEIVITPLFIARIDILAKRLAEISGGLVPVQRIFFEAIKRGQVKSATKPPDGIGTRFLRDKKAHVGVAGRYIGIVRVDHQRHAHRFKAATRQLRPVCSGGCRHLIAMHVRKVDARLLKHRAVAQHAALTAAAARTLPAIFSKRCAAIFSRQLVTNLILQCEQERFYAGNISHFFAYGLSKSDAIIRKTAPLA